MDSFVGPKKIKQAIHNIGERTAGGIELVKVEYEDGSEEHLSELMFAKVVSDKSCDLSALRDKRLLPVVEVILGILRDWGIKIGELPYFSSLLMKSLDYNTTQALIELWSHWMPRPRDPEDIDLVTIDRVLKSTKKTLNDLLGDQK